MESYPGIQKDSEALFKHHFKQGMIQPDYEGFKKTYRTLFHKVIIPSISQVLRQKRMLQQESDNLRNQIKELEKCVTDLDSENETLQKINTDIMEALLTATDLVCQYHLTSSINEKVIKLSKDIIQKYKK